MNALNLWVNRCAGTITVQAYSTRCLNFCLMSFCRVLNLTLVYAPLSMFRWQMYAAQGMRNRWYSILGEDFIESSDEDQDSLKVGGCIYVIASDK